MLFEEAKAQGVGRLMVDHPEFLLGCDIEDMKTYAAEGSGWSILWPSATPIN